MVMSNNNENTQYYYQITNGKYVPTAPSTVLIGDDILGVSDVPITPAIIYKGSIAVAQIDKLKPTDSQLEDLEKLELSDPVSHIPRLGWMLDSPREESERPKWKRISECGKADKLDLDFILPGLPRKSVGTLVSPGGTGKSMAILQTATCCVLGKPSFLNLSRRKRTVAYLSLEDPDEVLHNRLHDLYHKIEPNASEAAVLDDNLLAASMSFSVATTKDNPNPDVILDLFEVGQKPDLIILDTVRRAHQLDENSAGEMSTFIACLEEVARYLDCAILMLHHTSKGATFSKAQGIDPGASASRGSSVLVDNARAVWTMHVMSSKEAKELDIDDNARRAYIRLAHDKCNYQRAMDPVWLKRDDSGLFDVIDEEVLSLGEVMDGENKEGGDDEKVGLF
jgi:RecA-family ATPase